MKFLSLVLVSIQTGKCGLKKQIIGLLVVSPLERQSSLSIPLPWSVNLWASDWDPAPFHWSMLYHPVLQILHSSDSLTCALGRACLPCGHKLIFFFLWVSLPGAPSPSPTGPSAGLLLSSWLGTTARFPAILSCLILFFLTLGSSLVCLCLSHPQLFHLSVSEFLSLCSRPSPLPLRALGQNHNSFQRLPRSACSIQEAACRPAKDPSPRHLQPCDTCRLRAGLGRQ